MATKQLKTAADKFELALRINPNDRDVFPVIKQIYFKLKDKTNEDRIDRLIN